MNISQSLTDETPELCHSISKMFPTELEFYYVPILQLHSIIYKILTNCI